MTSEKISINLFGGLYFQRDNNPILPRFGAAICELFSILAVNFPKPVRRDKLIDMVWRDKPSDQAKSSLNTALWRITSELDTHNLTSLIQFERSNEAVSLKLYDASVTIDCLSLRRMVIDFENLEKSSNENARNQLDLKEFALRAALDNCQDEFLPALESDWVMQERERFRCLYIRGCQTLMRYFIQTQDYELALNYGHKLLRQDYYREKTQRHVMWLYAMNGERHSAIRQYSNFVVKLEDDMGTAPMDETQDLYQSIQNNTLKNRSTHRV